MKKLLAGLIVASALFGTTAQATDIKRLNPTGVVDSSQWGFSQAVVTPANGHYIFIAGQFAGDEDGNVLGTTMEAQMKQTFKNMKTVIQAAGGKPEHVVQVRMLIKDHKMEYTVPLEQEMRGLFGEHFPASTLIPVPALALPDMMFELEATLFVPAKS